MTKLDIVLLYLLGGTFLTVCIYTIVKNLVLTLFITFLLLVFFRVLFLRIYTRRKRKKVINTSEMETELSLMGPEQRDFFFSVVPAYYKPEMAEAGVIFTNKERVYLATNYKFSPTNADDVARFYRYAKKEKILVVWVLGRYPARQVMTFAASLDVIFRFIPSKKVHAFLRDANALMPRRNTTKNPRKINFKHILSEAFTKKRAKYFALSCCCLSFFSLFGAFRVYYLVFAGLSLLLTLFCATRKT